MSEELDRATVELLGALAYGQLRSFETTARTIPLAPDARIADQVASFAVEEHGRYVQLRDQLARRTELAVAVIDRQRSHFDAYFDRAPLDDWFGASVFFALGLPIASDFARAIASALDEETAGVVVAALDRGESERAALQVLAGQLTDEDARARARRLTADLLGRALTGFQSVVSQTDALQVLLTADRRDDETGEQRVKRLALEVMDGHRRRAVELGLEDLDDVS